MLARALLLLFLTNLLPAQTRPRVLVLTDISSLTAGVKEPDDGQSLIRLLLYSSEFDLEGLIASSNLGHGQTVRPDLIHQAIDAYAACYPNLRRHHKRFPQPAFLHRLVQPGKNIPAPSGSSSGAAVRTSPRPSTSSAPPAAPPPPAASASTASASRIPPAP